jgi:hypothetical protein
MSMTERKDSVGIMALSGPGSARSLPKKHGKDSFGLSTFEIGSTVDDEPPLPPPKNSEKGAYGSVEAV